MNYKLLILLGLLMLSTVCIAQNKNKTATRNSHPSNKEITITPGKSSNMNIKKMQSLNDTIIEEVGIRKNYYSEKPKFAVPISDNNHSINDSTKTVVRNTTLNRQKQPSNITMKAIPANEVSSSNIEIK